ncbi:MAG: YbaB/EbfC family nucleoid-associated protein [Mycobacteriaceae bacterium]
MTEAYVAADQLLADADARLAAIEQTSREVAKLTASARTPEGTATVTVGAGGSVHAINLTADALRGNPAQLGAALVAAIQAASADVARQSASLLAERTGIDITELASAAQVLAGDPATIASAAAEPQTSRVEDDEADEDWWRRDH